MAMREDKAAVTFAQFLELLRRLDFLEVHGRRSVRFLGVVTHRSSSLRLASPHRLPWSARDDALQPILPM